MSMVDARPVVGAPGTTTGRVAALAGAVSFALILIGATMLRDVPSATDSGQKILSYLALHHGRLQLGAVLTALAMATALVWATGLSRAPRMAEGGTPGLALAGFGGGVLTAASTVTWVLVEGTMATRFGDLGPAGARVLWTMFLLNVGAMLVGLLVIIGATAIVCLRTRLFPAGSRWPVPCWRSSRWPGVHHRVRRRRDPGHRRPRHHPRRCVDLDGQHLLLA